VIDQGAGVKLERAFGFRKAKEFDPFLLLEDFCNDKPRDYSARVPVTSPLRDRDDYLHLAGSLEHGDSLGHKVTIGAGNAQWMTARAGFCMRSPKAIRRAGCMVSSSRNLPAAMKMTDLRHQDTLEAKLRAGPHALCGQRFLNSVKFT